MGISKKHKKICTVSFIAILVIGFLGYQVTFSDVETSISIFDVGQGSSHFIQTKEGVDILIDGGPSSSVVESLGKVLPWHDHYIDIVILTHPHADHLKGLLEVIKRYKVGMVYVSLTSYESLVYQRFLKEVDEIVVQAPLTIMIDEDTSIEILYPFAGQLDFTNANFDCWSSWFKNLKYDFFFK